MPFTFPTADRYGTTPTNNAMAPAQQQPPNPWDTQPKPADTTGRAATFGAIAGGNAMAPTGGRISTGLVDREGLNQPGTQPPQTSGNAMYPPNGGGLRVDPNYLPENWNYQQSPEYQQRLAWAQRDLNRQLLSMGRSDSTGGINAMARQQGEIAGQEIDKQYQRALQANMTNYGRMFGANVENYGRTRGEDQTGWDRAAYLDQTGWNRGAYLGEQDWNRNYQLANMGLGATNTSVASGAATGQSLATLLSNNGASQAALALSRGSVDAGMIERLLNSGFGFAEIERLFGGGNRVSPVSVPGAPSSDYGGGGALPPSPVPDWMNQPQQPYSGGSLQARSAYDFFQDEG